METRLTRDTEKEKKEKTKKPPNESLKKWQAQQIHINYYNEREKKGTWKI